MTNETFVERARAVDFRTAAGRLGARLKTVSACECAGPCPRCGGVDRFSINWKRNVWNCRGAEGGRNPVGMAMHAAGVGFLEACEIVLGEPRPAAARAAPRPDADAVQSLLSRMEPLAGTHAEAYLIARAIHAPGAQLADLGFIRDVDYWGFADAEAERPSRLAALPVMAARVRRIGEREPIGVQLTFLDPVAPRKWRPCGDDRRNGAKKFRKRVESLNGGMIRLGPEAPALALGEGVETVLSAAQLGLGANVSFASALSLGNLSGGATDQLTHPTRRGGDGRPIRYPNGRPDMARPGVRLSPDVRRVILLGDGDSEPIRTSGHLLTAAARYRAEGRTVDICAAPPGADWNDVLMARRAA